MVEVFFFEILRILQYNIAGPQRYFSFALTMVLIAASPSSVRRCSSVFIPLKPNLRLSLYQG